MSVLLISLLALMTSSLIATMRWVHWKSLARQMESSLVDAVVGWRQWKSLAVRQKAELTALSNRIEALESDCEGYAAVVKMYHEEISLLRKSK